jgi:fido (protein-threonine AMPylation protein)
MVLVWKPITDLPEDWSDLSDGELGPLLRFWNDQRADLEQTGALAIFTQRLAREWSIETGQIEGVYDLDRGLTQTLIEKGINADLIPSRSGQKPPELIAAIIQDHADVLEGLFQFVRGERPLSKSYIHELHAALMKHQDTTVVRDQFGQLFEARLLKGKCKERPNNPQRPDGTVYEFCPPEQVEPEMERLLAMQAEHEKRGVPVEVEAAWLHHRFTQIHPYQDGNGRVARALASLLFIKAGWFPVVVTREDRARYLDSLEVADEGDLRSLVSFFVHVQKRTLIELIGMAADIEPAKTVDEAIAAAKQVLTVSTVADPAVWSSARDVADRLMHFIQRRLEEVAASLSKEIGKRRPEFRFPIYHGSVESLPQLPYHANESDYDQSRVLSIAHLTNEAAISEQARIEFRAHAVGSKFRGLIGIVAVFRDHRTAEVTSREPFQVNYAESYENAERRFRPWLEESLVNALTLWRKSL